MKDINMIAELKKLSIKVWRKTRVLVYTYVTIYNRICTYTIANWLREMTLEVNPQIGMTHLPVY